MKRKIPKIMLRSAFRRGMWDRSQKILGKIEKVLPVSSAYVLGSFTTRKKRPADVDFILLLKLEEDDCDSRWSSDFVIAPENKFGEKVLDDAKKWMKQKYGAKKSEVVKIK